MSFALTTEQIRRRTKTVTRRLGWRTLVPGDLVQPVVKAQGLKKGEHPEKIAGPIRVVSVRHEKLIDIVVSCREDVAREGFPEMKPMDFVDMFCEHNDCDYGATVTRIEFEYTEAEW